MLGVFVFEFSVHAIAGQPVSVGVNTILENLKKWRNGYDIRHATPYLTL